jgi:hypothetical protein
MELTGIVSVWRKSIFLDERNEKERVIMLIPNLYIIVPDLESSAMLKSESRRGSSLKLSLSSSDHRIVGDKIHGVI